MQTITIYECDAGCGFYRNRSAGPCRRIGCDGVVRAVLYDRRPDDSDVSA